MYNITDKYSAVKSLQGLLGLNKNGIYDITVTNKVKQLQNENLLEDTGIVNYQTFQAIQKSTHDESIETKIRTSLPQLKSFPYSLGDYGNDVLYINTLIGDVIKKHNIDIPKPRGRYFGNDTLNAVRSLREAFLLRKSDEIDEMFIHRILRII